MKCPNCNGVPYDEVWTCEVCNGKGIVEPLTEQEYLQTCSIEQLAELLYDIRYDYQIPWKNKGVVEWLKQPHTNE